MRRLGIRWTVGDVSSRGFEALALSIEGALKVFGNSAEYVVCVNTISLEQAQAGAGSAASRVRWVDASTLVPSWLLNHMGPDLGAGMLWKLAPIRYFVDLPELSLDNDVILWRMPPSVEAWLSDGDSLLIAEDVEAHYGDLARLCGPGARNAGIRGLPPDFDAESRIRALLENPPHVMRHDCDEQGLQVALVTREKHRVVPLTEVAVCGYFRPHLLELGSCGAHFVGVNSKKLPWEWQGRSGEEYVHEFWDSRRSNLIARLRS